jgi:hypothetical protein
MNRSKGGFFIASVFVVAVLLAAPAFALADAQTALFAAYQKMLDSRVATETVSTDESGKQTKAHSEFDTIDRVRVVTDQVSFVILPEGTWMRSGNGAWSQPPFDMSKMFKQLLPRTLEEVRAGTKNIKDEGEKSVNGQNTRALSYDVDTRIMGIAVSSHTTIYIDADGRIVRSESDGVAMGKKTHSVQDIRYDDSIRVKAPD